MSSARIVESKHTLDGRVQTFVCDALLVTPRQAIVRFRHPEERRSGGFHFPAGSETIGYFWRRRAYNCYRIAGPDGRVIVYRFDVVDRVRIAADRLSYRDLLLDVLVTPAGEVLVEDEDEVAEAVAAGRLSQSEHHRIEATRALLVRGHRRIIAGCEAVLAALPGQGSAG